MATVTGDVQITSFSGILTGVPYQVFLKQDATGGHTFRFPNGTSTMFAIDPAPNSITPVVFVKLPNGSLFAKFKSFTSPVGIGLVSAMIGRPTITNPIGSALLSFTWTKSAAIGYGGTLTDLYSDWEIASDNLYSALLFSSYLDTVHLSSIDVILAGGGTVYMRTRYGGKLDGVAMTSEWASGVLQLGTFSGDEFWDQTVLCINANKYGWEGSRKIVDEKGNQLTIHGNAKISDTPTYPCIYYDGDGDYLTSPSGNFDFKNFDFCVEIFFEYIGSSQSWYNFLAQRTSSVSSGLFIGYASGVLSVQLGNGVSWETVTATCTFSVNTRYHLAVFRNNGNLYIAVNGVVVKQQAITSTISSGMGMCIGFDRGNPSVSYLNSRIYSVRITLGVSRYTSNFSVDLTNPYFETGNLWWTSKPKVLEPIYDTEYLNWDKTISCVNFYGVTIAFIHK